MTTIIRTPANHGQLSSGDPEGARSCVAYSFAYAVSYATDGRVHPTGRQIRERTGDTSGGLELSQCDRAITSMTDLEPMTGLWTEAQWQGYLDSGWVGVLLGGYFPIMSSRFSGQPRFADNHGIMDKATTREEDPLADGRRSGIYRYRNEVYGRALRNAFAARLRLGNRQFAGPNHFEGSLIRIEGLSSGVMIPADFEVRVDPTRTLRVYEVDFARKWITDGRWARTGGFTAKCTGRQLFHTTKMVRQPDGSYERHTDYSEPRYIVRLLSGVHGDSSPGARDGLWINVVDPDVHLRRL